MNGISTLGTSAESVGVEQVLRNGTRLKKKCYVKKKTLKDSYHATLTLCYVFQQVFLSCRF